MLHKQLRAVLIGICAPVYVLQAQSERTHRDGWQQVDEIFAALGVQEGAWIADIGAGRGFFTLRFAPRLGSTGRLFAVDIDETALAELRQEVNRRSLDNVEIVLSETDDPKLPNQSLDAAFIVISYHEMSEHEAMLAGIRRALKPQGRLVIVDNPARDPGASRSRQMRLHHLDISLVQDDLERAGFDVLEHRPDFIDLDHGGHRHRQWMLIAIRAKPVHP